jgi:hypothetical protein
VSLIDFRFLILNGCPQAGADLPVPVRPDQGGSGQVQQRAAGVVAGGAQEHGLVELRRAPVPHAAAEPTPDQVPY